MKQVTFNPFVEIKIIHHWLFAHHAARCGMVLMIIDQRRFEKRIRDTEKILNPVLNPDHRKRIYNERFKLYINPSDIDHCIVHH